MKSLSLWERVAAQPPGEGLQFLHILQRISLASDHFRRAEKTPGPLTYNIPLLIRTHLLRPSDPVRHVSLVGLFS